MTRHLRPVLAFGVCAGLLAGCGNRDPYKRDDVWYPTGANAANLAAQVAHPADLVRGQNDPRQAAGGPARSVSRVWSDTPKSLTPGASGGGGGSGSGGGGSSSGFTGASSGSSGGDAPTNSALPSFPSLPALPGLLGGG